MVEVKIKMGFFRGPIVSLACFPLWVCFILLHVMEVVHPVRVPPTRCQLPRSESEGPNLGQVLIHV